MIDLVELVRGLVLEPPGAFFFHIFTLFALLGIIGMHGERWRRTGERTAVYPITGGSLIIGLHFIWLAATFLLNGSASTTAQLLPPFSALMQTLISLLFIWAVTAPLLSRSRLFNLTTGLGMLLLVVMGVFFYLQWQPTTAAPFGVSIYAGIWSGLQTALFIIGFVLTIRNEAARSSLAPLMMLIFAGTAVIALAAGYNTTISPWHRVGQLLVWPLWAVYTFQLVISPSPTESAAGSSVATTALPLLRDYLTTNDAQIRQGYALALLETLLQPAFSSLGTIVPGTEGLVEFFTPPSSEGEHNSRQQDLESWPAFTALRQESQVMVFSGENGRIREAYALYELLAIGPFGALLAAPLRDDEGTWGIALLAAAYDTATWSAETEQLFQSIVTLIGETWRQPPAEPKPQISLPDAVPHLPTPPDTTTLTAEIDTLTAEIDTLTAEKEALLAQLAAGDERLLDAEKRAAAAAAETAVLTAKLTAAPPADPERITELEKEVASLREALMEAEDAMALASAGEGGLSTEWVMMTITRYSGQLEAAQAMITQYQNELAKRDAGFRDSRIISLIQELRTPMTSINGFTDLLLTGAIGMLGGKQRDVVNRVRANTERMGSLLDQILQIINVAEPREAGQMESVDVQEVLETAVSNVVSQVREKNLHLDLDITPDLPPLQVNRQDLQQILSALLNNACLASPKLGRIIIAAHHNRVADPHAPDGEAIPFLQLMVQDSGGGIATDKIPLVFNGQYQADNPLITGLGDRDAGLAVANQLAIANGGRIWVQSEAGSGTQFFLLFPFPENEEDPAENLPAPSLNISPG